MTSVACRVSAPWIHFGSDEQAMDFGPVRRHVSVCLRCQAGLVRRRKLVAQRDNPTVGVDIGPLRQRFRLIGAIGGAAAVAIGLASVRRSSAG